MFPKLLLDKLWHTTSPSRYQMILDSGMISPDSPILEKDRWGTARGPDFYPFVRSIGGISLFDFKNFNPDLYNDKYPLSNWHEFVPYRRKWGEAIWIEINRDGISENYIDGGALLKKWKAEEAFQHNIMPIIESASVGPIPVDCFNCVYKCGKNNEEFEIVN